MGLGDVYKSLEDKYYAAVDWLDAKGLSLYPLIDKIEEHNIPSFPVAFAVILLILGGIFFAFGTLVLPQASLALTVYDAETGLALEGAAITVTTGSGAEITGTTDSDGKLALPVPAGEATAEISKSGYEKSVLSLNVSGLTEREIELEPGIQMLSRTIQLMKTGTNQLLAEAATIRFTCSNPEASSFEETKASVSGTIELQAPSNCGSLVAAPVSGFTIPNGVIELQETAPQLFLQPIETNVGTVQVSIENLAGQALAGITAMVYSHDGLLAGTQYSSTAGTAVFDNIPTGSYYIVVHDSQGSYADFDSSLLGETGLKDLAKNATISFEVKLGEASVGAIKVIVRDSSTRQPVENAHVYLKKGGAAVDEEYSTSEGIVEFSVSENVEYELQVDADAYLIALVKNVKADESFNEIYLEAATADNTQVLNVEVVDNRQLPIDNVRLVLKKADGTIYANNVVTGADGTGSFTSLPLGTYYVYAVKKGFEGRNSDPITIKARQENLIRVVLPIGFGNLEVAVLNDELQPVQGAVVEAINAVEEEKEQEEITNLEGKTVFNFRADKKVYFKVDAEGFLPYYSIAVLPDADSTLTTEIILAKDPGHLQVKLLGLYYEDEAAPKELSPGTKYKAKALLLLPRNTYFEEAGLHLRVGSADEGKTNIMEEDSLYLKDVFASSASVLKGTSFTPPKGYAVDSTHLTTGDSKWLNVTWKNASEGAYAVEAEVQVEESASLGQMLYISYRGWGKKGSYTRFPADAALAGAESTAAKQALYANAKQRAFTAGPSSLCGTNFCKTYSIEDKARNLKVSVVSQYNATIGSMYRLNFLISSTADQAFTNSEIEFGSKGDGLRFENYAITDATGLRSEGTAEGYLLAKGIGDMRKESSVFGYIDFKTEKEGSNILTVVIKSNNQPVLSETIDIRVAAAEQLQLDMIPKEIIPGIDNQIAVRVSDEAGEAVSNAIVTVTLEEALVLSTESNGSGKVEFKLESPSTGSTLVVKAEKIGYKEAELENLIDAEILTVTPPEINERLDIALSQVEDQILFRNQTVLDLVISKLRFSSSFKELVEFEWDDDYIGEKIDADRDLNAFLLIKLSEKGALVTKPVKLEGSLSISLFSSEQQQTFVENVPIEIRISQGGDVDKSKCIEIAPVKWDLITSSEESISQEFALKNNCKVENNEIALSGLQARIEAGKDNSLGRFTISSDELPNAKTLPLDATFASFAEVLPAGFEGQIRIGFAPNSSVDSGTAKPKIELRAVHAAEKGQEKILAKLPIELHVSNLSKCIEVVADEPITVETVPFNLGFGQYSGSYNPSYAGGYGGYQGVGGYGGIPGVGGYGGGYGGIPGTGGGYLGGYSYPSPNFTSPYYTNYYNQASDDNWRYGLGENSFNVKNNCASAVEIDLDIPSRLRVEEEEFELQPNSDKTVRVEAGYRMGKYDLGVFAKRKGSEDKAQKIDSLDVIVRRQGEIDEECIELSTSKIKLNNFIGKPVKSKIFNYCYDVGVRIPREGNVIQFNCRVAGQPMNTYRFGEGEQEGQTISLQTTAYGGYNNPFMQPTSTFNQAPGMYGGESYAQTGPWGSAYGQAGLGSQGYNYPSGAYPYGSSGWAYPQTSGFGSNCEIIDSVYVTDAYTRGSNEGKTIETVEFEIKPAINYRKMLCQYQSQMPFQTIYGLRVMLSQTYYRVNIDAAANVRYYNPFGGTTNKYFKVTLEDTWGIGDTIDECMYQSGQPGMSLERMMNCRERGKTGEVDSVVNRNALDLTAKGYSKGFVPQDLFNGDVFIYTADPDILKIPPAGSQDSIIQITPSSFVDQASGARVSLKPVKTDCPPPTQGGNWTIQVTVDRSPMLENVGCAKIAKDITLKIKRPMFWESTKDITLTLKVNVLNKNEDISTVNLSTCATTGPVTPPATTCPGGGKTKEAYKTYGFDRLPFNWTWNGIEKNDCDEEGGKKYFCDAVQFSIALNKKAAELKGFVDSLDLEENKENVREALEINEEGLSSFQNSKNLFRWVKKQVRVEDNSEQIEIAGKPEAFIFFMKDKELLLNEPLEKGNMEAQIKVVTDSKLENAADAMAPMTAVLNELQAGEADEDSIVGLFDKNEKTDALALTFEGWGVEYNEGLGKYAWTFKEFKKFHENLNAALDTIGTSDVKCFKTEIVSSETAESKEEAKLCFVKTFIGTERDVASNKLQDIYNANLQFVVGIRHTENLDLDSDLGKKVLKEAADIESAKLPDGYSSFEDFYNKVIDFNAFLVKDGYSSDLRADFAGDAEYANASGTGFGSWSFSYEGKEGDVKLPKAGLFNVLLDYRFGGAGEWAVEFKGEKSLAEIDASYAKNPFFEMPFDGEVGSGRRNDYGVDFRNVGTGEELHIAYAAEGMQEKQTRFVEASDSSNGIANYSFNYGKTFTQTSTGTILDITTGSPGTFNYSPSAIAEADITLEPRRDAGVEGLLYRLEPMPAGVQSWFTIMSASSSQVFKDQALTQQQADILCKETTAPGFRGFAEEIERRSEYKAVTFVPLSSAENYKLQAICAQGDVTMKGPTGDESRMPAGHRPAGATYSIGLNPTLAKEQRTLHGFIKKIETGEVCFVPKAQGAELRWNTEELLKS